MRSLSAVRVRMVSFGYSNYGSGSVVIYAAIWALVSSHVANVAVGGKDRAESMVLQSFWALTVDWENVGPCDGDVPRLSEPFAWTVFPS